MTFMTYRGVFITFYRREDGSYKLITSYRGKEESRIVRGSRVDVESMAYMLGEKLAGVQSQE